jgi:hypothetical protein
MHWNVEARQVRDWKVVSGQTGCRDNEDAHKAVGLREWRALPLWTKSSSDFAG